MQLNVLNDLAEAMKALDGKKPSMLGVGLEIPSFRALIPLFKSFATIRTLTRDSLLYAETHLLRITRMSGCFFFNASTSACPMTFPAPHFSKFPISSFIPSKPRVHIKLHHQLLHPVFKAALLNHQVSPSHTGDPFHVRTSLN